jgi:hypothetical protein
VNIQSKNSTVTAISLCFAVVGSLACGFSGFLHLPASFHMSLVVLGLALGFISLIPMLYENWTKHGKIQEGFHFDYGHFHFTSFVYLSSRVERLFFLNSH